DGIRDPLVTGVQTCARPICMTTNETIAAANETATEAVARKPATRAGIRIPPATISAAAASGENRHTQAAAVTAAGPSLPIPDGQIGRPSGRERTEDAGDVWR